MSATDTTTTTTTLYCKWCSKKLGLFFFTCKCKDDFCKDCIFFITHKCQFDYKAKGKEQCAKENVKIIPDKIKFRMDKSNNQQGEKDGTS
jgi:hypothetical protein